MHLKFMETRKIAKTSPSNGAWKKAEGSPSLLRLFRVSCGAPGQRAFGISLALLLLSLPAVAAQTSFASRNPSQDFDTLLDVGNNTPPGLWSDGQTMWVIESGYGSQPGDDKLYAYDLATKQRDPAKDFNTLQDAGNRWPTGLWSDGTTMWVADWEDDKIYAYKMSDKSRDSAKDFDTLKAAGNTNPTGLWSDGTTMWVSDTADRIYAYKMSDKSRDAAREIDINGLIGNRYIQGIWSDGTTMWAVDYTGQDNDVGNKIYAFNLSGRTRDASKDFDTLSAAGNNTPRDIWSDGTTMWVPDSLDDKIYAYRLSDAATLSSLSLSGLRLSPAFDSGTVRYTASILQSGAQTTVAATAAQSTASVSILPADADTMTAGHQVALANGMETYIIITVTPSSGQDRAYIVAITNQFASRNPSQDLNNLNEDDGINSPYGLWSDGVTIWVLNNSKDPKLFAYDLATKQRDPAEDIGGLKAAGNANPKGIWSDGTTMWITDWDDDNIRAYKMSDKSRDSAKDFDTLKAAGNTNPTGLWSDGTTMWVADTGDRIYAYKMSDKSRDASKEIDVNSLIGNRYIQGIWSDGTTMWASNYSVSNNVNNKIYAFHLSARTRDAAKDFDSLSAAGNNQPRGLWSDGATMWVADSQDDKIYAYRLSDAATLSSLSLSGLRLSPAFDSGTVRYTASILQSGAQTTVAATAAQSTASVSILPADADTMTAGHQVALANGMETYIIITVTPSSGQDRAYIVAITNQFASRNPSQDLNTLGAAGNTASGSLWSDGTTMWVMDWEDIHLYAYNLADKSRDASKDFDRSIAAENTALGSIWSDGVTMWILDYRDNKIYAYKMSDKSRDASKDFDTLRTAGNTNSAGLWSNGATMWTADSKAGKIYAYKMADKSRDASKDFNTLIAAGNAAPNRIWSDGTTMWVVDRDDAKIYAYKMSDKSRDVSKDFDTLVAAGNEHPRGLWSDGTTMWVTDPWDEKIYAYHLSDDVVLSGLSLSDNIELSPGFDGAVARYTASVPYAITNLTIAATALHADAMVSILPGDADANTAGHQMALSVGANNITITVTLTSGLARTYAIVVARGAFLTSRNPAQDFNTLDGANVAPQGLWSDGTTMWVADGRGGKIDAYKMSDKTRDVSKDFNTNTLAAAGNSNPATLWSNGTTIWVTDWYDDKLYAYNLATKSRDSTKDFNTLIVAGNTFPGGIWSDGTTMWVADTSDAKIYAYKMSDKSRDPAKDFDTLIAAGNTTPNRIWSDGTTMWVTNRDGDVKIYAYDMASGRREPGKDFDTLVAAGNEHPRGLWSDGATMWVSDPWDDRIYAYRQPPAPSGDNALKALALSGATLSPAFAAGTTNYMAGVSSTIGMTTVSAQANHARASVVVLPADADGDALGHQVALAEGSNVVTILVAAENGSLRNYAIAVTRRSRSGDNNLRSLRLVGHALSPSFLPVSTRYTAVVGHPVNLVTIAATASHADAAVSILPADADVDAAGHQIVLAEGNNRVAVTVTAPNGAAKDYLLVVRRASIGVTGWNPLRDLLLASVNTAPRGIWSDGGALWTADSQDAKIYAYDLASNRREAGKDFNALRASGNADPAGLWSDGETLWVADKEDAKIYAYDIDGKSYAATNDFSLASGNADPAGLWSDGKTLWVVDDADDHLYAYRLAGKSRDAGGEFSLEAGNDDPAGLWSDGETLWVADREDAKIYAYDLARKRRAAGKDFNTLRASGNEAPWGLWGDGETLWVADEGDGRLYAYHLPPSGDAALKALALSGATLSPAFAAGTTNYMAGVSSAMAMTTVSAQANHARASVVVLPADADGDAPGHQVALAEGSNVVTILVAAPNRSGRAYRALIHRASSGDASLRSLALSGVPINFSSNTNHYQARVSHLTLSTTVSAVPGDANARVAIAPADADGDAPGHQVALAEGNNAIAITVIAPNGNSRIYTAAIHRALSGDASLRLLRLRPVLTLGRDSGNPRRYTATVSASTASATIEVTANHARARVVFFGEDADGDALGHQVALAEGNNTIALAVIAADRSVETYTIVVRRAAAAAASLRGQAQALGLSARSSSTRTEARAVSGGGVRFVFEVEAAWLAAPEKIGVEACAGLGGEGQWRLLEAGAEYQLALQDNGDGTAQAVLILPRAHARQTFLRLVPQN